LIYPAPGCAFDFQPSNQLFRNWAHTAVAFVHNAIPTLPSATQKKHSPDPHARAPTPKTLLTLLFLSLPESRIAVFYTSITRFFLRVHFSPHSACFLPDADGRPRGKVMCRKHKEDDMINMKAPKCPSRGYEIDKKNKYCENHATEEMVIFRKECATEGCKVTPNYGFERSRTHCVTHKQSGMCKPNTVARTGDSTAPRVSAARK